ncbi:3-phenylpropionate/trans-cinnamate dioxygenase ferredoxin reductase subunit [Prauserella sediminis]|uniref:3-phenylpropionate/trans-cinnamate dioxygenase ferredoxin reductase subunit n=1 Tax=Prauserella sediminis TaxID=577680 RepID=A0A839XT35_9PSEU|nr:FAD/NAD(P)-binding oxidoreductase [Prauserella sediminis]MBB3664584.1 3-phenylpropionate/trans-cinnamate dioxygenase ferredoxin reductase subunit [Prauserella sediminis]
MIGAGHAGVQVVEALRAAGHTGPLTLVGDEPSPPYQRPPLSKEHLGTAGIELLPLRGTQFFAEQRIELCTGVSATMIDRSGRRVHLSDGRELPYDSLVIACGAANRGLPVPGSDLEGVHSLRTLADAEAVRAAMAGCESALVVGAGFIGLEFAAAARKRGLPVTVVEAAERPLGRALSAEMANHIAEAHRNNGVDLRLGTGVTAFLGDNGRVRRAIGTDGTEYTADLVLVGIGVVPRDDLATTARLAVDNGIVVDEHLRTSDPDIYAIGDCASFPHPFTGTRIRLESVQNATDQARHVAAAILGREEPGGYRELPWFWSHQGSMKLQIAGLRRPDDRALVLGDPADGKFSVCSYRGERLVAVESLNRPADHMAARRLLVEGRAPAPEQLDDPGFSLKTFARALTPTP